MRCSARLPLRLPDQPQHPRPADSTLHGQLYCARGEPQKRAQALNVLGRLDVAGGAHMAPLRKLDARLCSSVLFLVATSIACWVWRGTTHV